MPEQAIKPGKQSGYTGLYLDFLGKNPRVRKYLFSDDPLQVAGKIGHPKVNKGTLCDILVRQNEEFNAKPETFTSINKLRQDDALCIFAGQQAGLFGGPLLTLYKTIDIIKRASKLEKELARPVVPIFWIACDDHDFDEINHTFFLNRDGELEKVSYEAHGEYPVPVAEMCLASETDYKNLRQDVEKGYGGSDFSEELLSRLFSAYSFNTCLVKAFARHMTDILPDTGLIFFCPHDKEIKALSKGFFKQIVERYFQLKETLEATSQSLKNDNYLIQVEKKASAVHLFYHNPGRTPIHYLDGSFFVEEKRLGLTGMLDLIDKYPERFSPDVLTSPIWQSFLFSVVAHVGGPAEIAYFCQIGKLFGLFDVIQPVYYARSSATIVENRHEDLLSRLNINLSDLTSDIEQLINRVAAESYPEEIEEKMTDFRRKLDDDYAGFIEVVLKHAKNLEPMAKQTYAKIDFALKNFEKKIFSEHKKKMEAVRKQIYRLATALYPNRNMQERSLNIDYYISKYGFDVVDFLIESLDIETAGHQMIYISRYKSQR